MSIYRFTVIATHSQSGAQYTTHHYEFPGYVPTEVELEECLQGLADIFDEIILPFNAQQVTYNEIEHRRVDVPDLPSGTFIPDGWPVNGTEATNSLPHQVAAVLRWNAPEEYPRSGRIYLPSFGVGQCAAGGFLNGTTRTVLDGVAAAMEEIPVTGQVDAQRVAVKYGGTPRAVIASNVLFWRPTSATWGIQRRRRPGTGI